MVNAEGTALVAPTDWLRITDFHSVLDVSLMELIEIMLKLLPLLENAEGGIANLMPKASCGQEWPLVFGFFSSVIEMQHFGLKVSIVEHGFFKAGVVNSDVIKTYLLRCSNRLTPEFGDSYREKYVVESKRLCDSDISQLIKCMAHALIAKYPRTRYRAGCKVLLAVFLLSPKLFI
uniref:Uncharacterized protein n=1 Tax=Strigops habroptila TaxID=2489341 RepID=A0A672TES9_STRHB